MQYSDSPVHLQRPNRRGRSPVKETERVLTLGIYKLSTQAHAQYLWLRHYQQGLARPPKLNIDTDVPWDFIRT